MIQAYSGLKDFLYTTRVVSHAVSLEILEKILSNSIVFSGIPPEITKSINTSDTLNVIKFIEEDSLRKETTVNFIIKQLKKSVERKSFESGVIPKFELLVALDEKYPLDYYENRRLYEIIQDTETLNIIFDKNDLSATVSYCRSTYKQGLAYLANYVVNRINSEIVKEEKPNERWFMALKKIIEKFDDLSILEKIKESFVKYYFIDNSILDFERFTNEQLVSLISPEFLMNIVDKIELVETEDKYLSDFVSLAKHIEISNEIANHFLAKINLLMPDLNLQDIDQIDCKIQTINSFLDEISNDLSVVKSEIQNIFNKIVTDRKVPHPQPQYANSRQYDQPANYISQIISDSIKVNNLVIFCCHIYRITRNKVPIIDVLNLLLANPSNREPININLVSLLKQFILNPLFDFILSDSTYSQNSRILLKHSFTYKSDKEYLLSEEKLNIKLLEMLNFVFSGNEQTVEILNFLEDLSSNKRIREALIKTIPIQSKENILKLSNKLQALAIDTVLSGDNIFKYEDNLEFLKVVATNGSPNHIQSLTRLIISKLQQEIHVNDAVSILLEVKRLNNRDASRIRTELENYQSNETLNEIVTTALAHLENLAGEKELSK